MRNLIFVLLILIAGFVVTPNVEAKASTIPGIYDSLEACQEAFDNGYYIIYQSRVRTGAWRVKKLPTATLRKTSCVEQIVFTGSRKWTIQDTSILFVIQNGQYTHRYDCGNRVYNVVELEEKQVAVVIPPKEPVEKPSYCPNKPGMTYDRAYQLGYDVDEEGNCIKEKPVEKPSYCPNKPGMTYDRAYQLGYDVDEEGNCFKPQTIKEEVKEIPVCPNLDLTLEQARRQGYMIDKEGNCRKKSNKAILLCPIGIGAGVGALTAKGNRVTGALIGAGTGALAGVLIKSKTRNPYFICAGGGAGAVGYLVRKKPKKTLPPTGSPVPIRPGQPGSGFPGRLPTTPGDIPPGTPTEPCRRGANGQCLPPPTVTDPVVGINPPANTPPRNPSTNPPANTPPATTPVRPSRPGAMNFNRTTTMRRVGNTIVYDRSPPRQQ